MAVRTKDKLCWCEWCGHSFLASRKDARFCCPQHRTACFRAHKRFSISETNIKGRITDYLFQFRQDDLYQVALERLASFLADQSLMGR